MENDTYLRFTTTGGAGYGVFNSEWPRDFNPAGTTNIGVHVGAIEPSMPLCQNCFGSKLELFLEDDGGLRESPCRLCAGHGEIPRAVYEHVCRKINFRLCQGE